MNVRMPGAKLDFSALNSVQVPKPGNDVTCAGWVNQIIPYRHVYKAT